MPLPPRELRNPPITEALVDFRVASQPAHDVDVLLALAKQMADRYPIVDEQRGFEATIDLKEASAAPRTRALGLRGVLCRSADRTAVAQFRIDGCTHNRLKPYRGWDAMRQEAERLWRAYVGAWRPDRVTRLAVRYINHLTLPGGFEDLARFLTLQPPRAPAEGVLREALVQSVAVTPGAVPGSELTSLVRLTVSSAQPKMTIVILDLDVSDPTPRPAEAPDIFTALERLREVKNRLFFDILTSAALEFYT